MTATVPVAIFGTSAHARDATDALLAYGIPSVLTYTDDRAARTVCVPSRDVQSAKSILMLAGLSAHVITTTTKTQG